MASYWQMLKINSNSKYGITTTDISVLYYIVFKNKVQFYT